MYQKNIQPSCINRFCLVISLVLSLSMSGLCGDPSEPQPGDIYREYILTNSGNINWRVTNPEATREDAMKFLPNPKLVLSVDDLKNAVKSTITLDYWGGHPKTVDRMFRINESPWIEIPYPESLPVNPELYYFQFNPTIEIPMEYLKQGDNVFEGTCSHYYRTGWGQWGWYAIIVRIYYSSEKLHPSGSIVSPVSGTTLQENPLVEITASSDTGIARVDVIGYYEDYDEDGDGIYEDWHYGYFKEKDITELNISGHIGSDDSEPYNVSWNTEWVPDQSVPGNIKLIARVQDNGGIWYVMDPVENLSLVRTGTSVQLYKPENVPQEYVARSNNIVGSSFTIASGHDLSNATEARLVMRRWNGDNHSEGTITTLNSWKGSIPGPAYFYDLIKYEVPVSSLRLAENQLTFFSGIPKTHGIELLWPGPGMYVRYNENTTEAVLPEGLRAEATSSLYCFPNPFKEKIFIEWHSSFQAPVRLRVFDASGLEIRRMELSTGTGTTDIISWDGIRWDGFPAQDGIYFIRFESESIVETRMIALVRN